jgi:hypothetical protein
MSISSNARTGDDENESLNKRRLDRFLELEQSSTGDRPEDLSVADLVCRRTLFSSVMALRSLMMTSRRVGISAGFVNTRLRFLGEDAEEPPSEALLGDG